MTGQAEYQYDVFISYSHTDKEWVHDWLLPRLEAAGLRVCIDFRDFDVGVPSLVNMERAVDNSRHTLLVLTPAWVKSEWTEFEELLTQTTDPAGRRRRLLPLLLRPCQPSPRIAMLTYADFSQEGEWESQLQRVVAAVRGELRLQDVGPQLSRLLELEGSSFTVPFMRNPDFVGREEELERLHQALMGEGPVGIRSAITVPAGLTGMGGIGKTQLAVEYAYHYQDAYSGGVFWINAAENLYRGFAQLGRQLHPATADRSLDEQIRAAVSYLRDHPDTLLIVDNLADPASLNRPVSVDLVLAALPCRILFTTRRRDLGRFQAVEVTVLPEEPALRLLLRHPARQPILDPDHLEHEEAQTICAVLGYLPLALEVAGAHLGRWPEAPLDAYLQELLARGALPVLDDPRGGLRSEDLPTRHDAAVAATLASQWKMLQSDNARLLLRVAGQLPEAALIPTTRLGLLAGLDDQETDFFGSPLALALRELEDGSLVEELWGDQVRLHPLVLEFAARQTLEEETPTFRQWCAANLATAYEDIVTLEDHCAHRGIDALQEDFIIGLGLLPQISGISEEFQSLENRLQSLLRLLQREAHTLRGWDRQWYPVAFAQQVHNRAVDMGLPHLAAIAVARLAQLGKPHLALRWRAPRESPALERTIITGHAAYPCAVAITPDGRRAISASRDGVIRVWNLRTGQEECTFTDHGDEVLALAVTPDGRHAISASEDGTIKMWDIRTGMEERTLVAEHKDEVQAVAVALDCRCAISVSTDCTLKVWDLQAGEGKRSLISHTGTVCSVTMTHDSQRAVSAFRDGTLEIWNIQTGQLERTFAGCEPGMRSMTATPDGRCAITVSKDRLKVWNLQSGQVEHTLVGHEFLVYAVAVTHDARRVISGSLDQTLKVWNLQTGQEEHTLAGHADGVTAIAVTPDSSRVVSLSEDGTLKVWNLQIGREGRTLAGHRYHTSAVAVTPDGRYAISASSDQTLKVWDIQAGQEQCVLVGHTEEVNAVAVTPDGHHAISASYDNTLRVWNLQTGQEHYTLTGHTHSVHSVAVMPNGHHAISASEKGTIKVWNLQTRQEEYTIASNHKRMVGAIAVTPDGHHAISASSDYTLKVWNLQTGQLGRTLTGHTNNVNAVAVTPDGRRAISASTDRTLKVWDLQTGKEERTLTGHKDAVYAVAVTPDGRRAISASREHTLRVWELETGQELAIVILESELVCVALAPDGATILVGDRAGNVYCLCYVENGG
jgi:WD40 repeat protein